MNAIVNKLPLLAVLAMSLGYASIVDAACKPDYCMQVYRYCVSQGAPATICEGRLRKCEQMCGFGG
ncbi:hypothetical protein RDV84_17475 [Lysobacter yananisis]|uniref:Uncharacterized protein n=2 Tax=Lysobacter TaxID=68 RepID=A0A0S2DI69_LYSEN|nr:MULTISPECIES: hypothetical protein [Lysobacter]ALN58347.1 hypothetical protein GLE_2999 [Lysobacter enzymogenes]QCW26759.1 hypothetical protein FE772_14990 [Lysobacter enzymogenes]UZW62903.1 hypothetical protein BV903_011705 [Lysobacter enzymogenes]WMT01750.1 hypothetical protein RDV84_17475 [Lysobacter yananisis]